MTELAHNPNVTDIAIEFQGGIIAELGRISAAPGGDVILVVTTDLQLNPQDSQFDFDAYTEVVRQAVEYVSKHDRNITGYRIRSTKSAGLFLR